MTQDAARNRKALAIARLLYERDMKPERTANLTNEAWYEIAAAAGQRPPSLTTRGIVVTILVALDEFPARTSAI